MFRTLRNNDIPDAEYYEERIHQKNRVILRLLNESLQHFHLGKEVYDMRTNTVKIIAVCVCTVIAFFVTPAAAQEMQKAYADAELAKVREWEKTWVGKKIDKTNVDQVAPFMLETLVDTIKKPDKWGAPPEGYYFTIRPYEFIPETPNFIAASKANAGKAKLAADGSIENLTELAGRLFMDPGEDAMKMAWNFEMQNRGDSFSYRKYAPNVNPRSRSERVGDQQVSELYFINRTEMDPKPVIPKNKKGYRRGMFMHMFLPAEMINTRMYTMRYIDQKKEDDSYLWYSQFRRIRRMNTSQRTDAIDGTDLIYDDDYLWDGQLSRNNYTYKGKRELLTDRHDGGLLLKRVKGQGFANNLSFERCNLLVVEAVNKDPNYIYSKRIWYLDPETYYIMHTEIYDKQGRYWKMFFNTTTPLQSQTGVMKPVIVGTYYADVQRTHNGLAMQQGINQPQVSDPDVTVDWFTTSYLQKTY